MRYESECEKCGKLEEHIASVTEHASIFETPCECGGKRVQIFTPTAFFLSPTRRTGEIGDTGFYTHDYGKSATRDLRSPEKRRRLREAGVIRDFI